MEVQNTKSPTINTELTNKKNDNMEEQLHLQLSEEEAIERSLEKDYFHSLNLQKQMDIFNQYENKKIPDRFLDILFTSKEEQIHGDFGIDLILSLDQYQGTWRLHNF